MNLLKQFLFTAAIVFSTATASLAQVSAEPVEMSDMLHANGKIYVVVTVIAIIFLGLLSYLILIDRKVSRLEKEVRERGKH